MPQIRMAAIIHSFVLFILITLSEAKLQQIWQKPYIHHVKLCNISNFLFESLDNSDSFS